MDSIKKNNNLNWHFLIFLINNKNRVFIMLKTFFFFCNGRSNVYINNNIKVS